MARALYVPEDDVPVLDLAVLVFLLAAVFLLVAVFLAPDLADADLLAVFFVVDDFDVLCLDAALFLEAVFFDVAALVPEVLAFFLPRFFFSGALARMS